ncbi:BTB/POZ domain-containing protein [Aphelenchoides avenae]|nr:BTB/POZ domain-containing protein [Aphelenchus avenae]
MKAFSFTTDRDIFISALGIYGIAPVAKAHIYGEDKPAAQWGCQVEIQLATISDPTTYGSSTSSFATNTVFLQGHLGDLNPVLAHFTEPVPCAANVTYVATVKFLSETGVQTFGGKDGQEQITVELPFDESVTFKFQSYRNSYGNDVGSQAEGQIPTLHFFVQWPESP